MTTLWLFLGFSLIAGFSAMAGWGLVLLFTKESKQ